jgi:hypothetical protein
LENIRIPTNLPRHGLMYFVSILRGQENFVFRLGASLCV